MSEQVRISRINLISPKSQRLWSIDESDARRRLLAGDAGQVLSIDGSFALVAQDGERVVLVRSLDRAMRYFRIMSRRCDLSDAPIPIPCIDASSRDSAVR